MRSSRSLVLSHRVARIKVHTSVTGKWGDLSIALLDPKAKPCGDTPYFDSART